MQRSVDSKPTVSQTPTDETLDNNERYIETLAVVDQKMVNYHGEDAATQFALVVMNNVSRMN